MLFAILVVLLVAGAVFAYTNIINPFYHAMIKGRYPTNPFLNPLPTNLHEKKQVSNEELEAEIAAKYGGELPEEKKKKLKKMENEVYSKSKVENVQFDAIVIGSGVGGLSVASALARANKKVLVLEQHHTPGGCCHTFTKKGYEFDTGIHYLGDLSEGSMNKTMLDVLTGNGVQFTQTGTVYDQVILENADGVAGKTVKYDIVKGKQEYKNKLIEYFPEEKEAIEKFIGLTSKVGKAMNTYVMLKVFPASISRLLFKIFGVGSEYFKFATTSLKEIVTSLTKNEKLQTVLCYLIGDYGQDPNTASFATHSVVFKHYETGASYPVGGPMAMVKPMVRVVQSAGGKVLVKALVEEILIDKQGKAIGVKMQRDQQSIFAPIVVSDAGIKNTLYSLLPEQSLPEPNKRNLQAVKKLIDSSKSAQKSSTQHMSVFIAVKGSQKELNLPSHNFWVFPNESKKSSNNIFQQFESFMNAKEVTTPEESIPAMFISFPGAKDPSFETKEDAEGKSVILVIAPSKFDWFAQIEPEELLRKNKPKKRSMEYQEKKEELVEYILKVVKRHLPQVTDENITRVFSGTPLTSKYYYNSPKGESYGSLDFDVERYKTFDLEYLKPVMPAEKGIATNLYLTGQDVLVCGYFGALAGGILCASAILKRNLMGDLAEVRNQNKNAKQKTE